MSMKKMMRTWMIAACMIATGILSGSEAAFTQEDGALETRDAFRVSYLTSTTLDDDGDGMVDEVVITFRVKNVISSACFQRVEFVECGEISRYIEDLGCTDTEDICPDFDVCGFDEFIGIHAACLDDFFTDIHVWGLCVNPDTGIEPDQEVAITEGLPVSLGDFRPGESKEVDVTLYGTDNLVHLLFSTELVADHRDSDCDGAWDFIDNCPTVPNPDQTDLDMDGYGEACECDDRDKAINPGAVESLRIGNCQDDKDNDCDGLIDEDDPGCTASCEPKIVPVSSGPIAICLIPLIGIALLGIRIFRR